MNVICTSQGLTLILLFIVVSFIVGLSMVLLGLAREIIDRRSDPVSCYGGLTIMLVSTANMILIYLGLTLN